MSQVPPVVDQYWTNYTCKNTTGYYVIISCYLLVKNHNTSLVLFDLSSEYNFFIKTYKLDCVGAGIDNSTQGHWIITNSDGINETLNAKVEHTPASLNTYVWKTTLKDGPYKYKSPYTYQCIVSNDCGVTARSKLVTINYPTPPTTGPTHTGPTPTPKG